MFGHTFRFLATYSFSFISALNASFHNDIRYFAFNSSHQAPITYKYLIAYSLTITLSCNINITGCLVVVGVDGYLKQFLCSHQRTLKSTPPNIPIISRIEYLPRIFDRVEK
jgi:hypothetical protein